MPGINLAPGLGVNQVFSSLQQQGVQAPGNQRAYAMQYQADQTSQAFLAQQRKRMGMPLGASGTLGFSLS